jgi:hypothetical protein
MVVRLSAYTLVIFTPPPQDIAPVLSSVRGYVDPRATVRPGGLCQWKIPMTPSRIKPATIRFVVQRLNHLGQRVTYKVSRPIIQRVTRVESPYNTHTHTHTHTHTNNSTNIQVHRYTTCGKPPTRRTSLSLNMSAVAGIHMVTYLTARKMENFKYT